MEGAPALGARDVGHGGRRAVSTRLSNARRGRCPRYAASRAARKERPRPEPAIDASRIIVPRSVGPRAHLAVVPRPSPKSTGILLSSATGRKNARIVRAPSERRGDQPAGGAAGLPGVGAASWPPASPEGGVPPQHQVIDIVHARSTC